MNFYKKISLFLWLALWTAIAAPQVSAQCYRQLFDASGFNTDPYQGSLGEAACALRETLPTEFKDQFKVFSCGFYVLQQNFKEFGYPEAFTLAEQQVAAQSPYYLLFGRQSDPTGIYTRFYVALKLPSTGVFRCITDPDRLFISSQVLDTVTTVYNDYDRIPHSYAAAEAAGMQRLSNYLKKAADCCIPGVVQNTCSLCPDENLANDLKRYFDEHCFMKIPITVEPKSPIFASTEGNNNLIQDLSAGLRIRFSPEGPAGVPAGPLSTVLNLSILEKVSKKKGIITSNQTFCSTVTSVDNQLATLMTEYERQSVGLWAHIWYNGQAQAYLYVAARNARESCIMDNGRDQDVLAVVNKALNTEGTYQYANKFIQTATALFAESTLECNRYLASAQVYEKKGYDTPTELSFWCEGNAIDRSQFFLTPACIPIKLGVGAIPQFHFDDAGRFGYDPGALSGFADGQFLWKGCFLPVELGGSNIGSPEAQTFWGYFNWLFSVQQYEATAFADINNLSVHLGSKDPSGDDFLHINEYSFAPTPAFKTMLQSTRKTGSGAVVRDFKDKGVFRIIRGNGVAIDISPVTKPDLETFARRREQIGWYTRSGTLWKIPKQVIAPGATPKPSDFHLIYCKYNGTANEFFIYDCALGVWTKIDNPYESPARGIYHVAHALNPALAYALAAPNPHDVFGALGLVPIIGEVFDLIDGYIYLMEGEDGLAVLAVVSALPAIGDVVVKGAKLTNKLYDKYQTLRRITRVVPCTRFNNADNGKSEAALPPDVCFIIAGVIDHAKVHQYGNELPYLFNGVAKFSEAEQKAFAGQALVALGKLKGFALVGDDVPGIMLAWRYLSKSGATLEKDIDLIRKLAKDFTDVRDLAGAFEKNPGLVKAWEVLIDFPIRLNIDALEAVSNHIYRFPAKTEEIKIFITNITNYQWPNGGIGTYSVREALERVVDANISKAYPNLSIEEIIAIHHYSRGISYPFNQALRGSAEMTPFFQAFNTILARGLSNLTPYVGTVYRGTRLNPSHVLSKYETAYKNGTPVSEDAYTSTSKITDWLSGYMGRNQQSEDVGVIFNIQSKTGKDIEPISFFGSSFPTNENHREVLFMPGVKFNVDAFNPKYDSSGNTIIYYELFLSEI